MRVLVVEDDRQVARLLGRLLEEEGYAVDVTNSGEEGRTLALVNDYDALVLDLELPDRHGLSILQELRAGGDDVPVLILTGQGGDDAVVRGLDVGADEYVVKPVSNAEFRARVRALVRRGGARRSEQLNVGNLTLNRLAREVRAGTQKFHLTPTEFGILEHVMLHAGAVVPRTDLLEKLWDRNADVDSNVVDVHLSRLRSKLEEVDSQTELVTVRGVGIKLVSEAEA